MKFRIYVLVLVSGILFTASPHAAAPELPDSKCAPGTVQTPEASDVCSDPGSMFTLPMPEGSLPLLLSLPHSQTAGNDPQQPLTPADITTPARSPQNKTIVYFFSGNGCPHCEEEQLFLDNLKQIYPLLEVKDYEVWYNRDNAGLMNAMLRAHGIKSSGVPMTIVGKQLFSGFNRQTGEHIEKAIMECGIVPCDDPAIRPAKFGPIQPPASALPFTSTSTALNSNIAVTIPLLGTLDSQGSSLALLTLVIAGMDSFNPCAFFVLLTLLGLLVHAQSRNKMLLIGGIFVFFSGFIYFLFMAAWLNLFLVMGHVATITIVAGFVSVVIAAINIKDFFLFKQGVSLSIPDSAKPKLFDRMRRLLRSTSLASIMIAATVLAVLANFYELLCTAGFPMVFTRILTLNNLSSTTYYLYLIFYNLIYVVPLFIIVLGFTVTLGKKQLTEWQGRVLKLVSGLMMLGLGAILLINPALLNNVKVSFIILAASLGVAMLIATVTKRWLATPGPSSNKNAPHEG